MSTFMSTFQIKNRFTGAAIFTCELPAEVAEQPYSMQLGYAAKEGIKARAYFADADFAGADFADADFADANFADANFARANFADADFACADFARAKNLPADMQRTDPPEPYVRATKPEHYAKRAERYRQRNPDVPVIPALDRQILEAIEGRRQTQYVAVAHLRDDTLPRRMGHNPGWQGR